MKRAYLTSGELSYWLDRALSMIATEFSGLSRKGTKRKDGNPRHALQIRHVQREMPQKEIVNE